MNPISVAITKHDETNRPEEATLEALKQAAIQLDNLLISNGLSVDDLVAEFYTLRKKGKV